MDREGAEVTSAGRSFQTRAPATAKALYHYGDYNRHRQYQCHHERSLVKLVKSRAVNVVFFLQAPMQFDFSLHKLFPVLKLP